MHPRPHRAVLGPEESKRFCSMLFRLQTLYCAALLQSMPCIKLPVSGVCCRSLSSCMPGMQAGRAASPTSAG